MWIKWAKQFCLQHGYSSTVTPRHSTTTWTLVRKKCIVLNAPHLNFFFFLMWCKMNEGSKAVHCADVYISFMLVFFQQWTNHLKKKCLAPGSESCHCRAHWWIWQCKNTFSFLEKTCLLMLLCQQYSELTFAEYRKCWVFAEYGELIYLWMDMGACGWPQIFITVAGTPVSYIFCARMFMNCMGA